MKRGAGVQTALYLVIHESRPDVHQPVRLLVGEGFEQHGADDAEDGGVHADPQRQRRHDDGRRERGVSQTPQRVVDIAANRAKASPDRRPPLRIGPIAPGFDSKPGGRPNQVQSAPEQKAEARESATPPCCAPQQLLFDLGGVLATELGWKEPHDELEEAHQGLSSRARERAKETIPSRRSSSSVMRLRPAAVIR